MFDHIFSWIGLMLWKFDFFFLQNLSPEFAFRMVDIRDVTDGIGKLRKSYN